MTHLTGAAPDGQSRVWVPDSVVVGDGHPPAVKDSSGQVGGKRPDLQPGLQPTQQRGREIDIVCLVATLAAISRKLCLLNKLRRV